jgi:hypothetical protein
MTEGLNIEREIFIAAPPEIALSSSSSPRPWRFGLAIGIRLTRGPEIPIGVLIKPIGPLRHGPASSVQRFSSTGADQPATLNAQLMPAPPG